VGWEPGQSEYEKGSESAGVGVGVGAALNALPMKLQDRRSKVNAAKIDLTLFMGLTLLFP
jgi:hypothetical protein